MTPSNTTPQARSASQNNPLQPFESGMRLLSQQRYAEAEELFREVQIALPSFPGAYIGLALAAQGDHRWAVALERWEECLRLFSHTAQPEWITQKGNVLLRLGYFEEAQQLFEDLIENSPLFPGGYTGAARLAQAQQEWEEALQRWNSCLQRFPYSEERPSWLFDKGRVLLRLGFSTEAIELYQQLLRDYPQLPEGRIGLALAAQVTQDFPGALRHWEQCTAQFAEALRPDHKYTQASLFLKLGLFREAEEIYRFLADHYPGDPLGSIGLARLAFLNGDIAESDAYWERIFERFGNNPKLRLKYIRYLITTSRHTQARALCREGMRKGPKPDITYATELCESYRRENKNQQALDEIEALERIYPNDQGIRLSKAYTLLNFWTRDRIEQAVPLLEDLVKENSVRSSSRTMTLIAKLVLIEAYIKSGRFQQAQQLLDAIPNSADRSTRVSEFRAWQYQQQQKVEQAKQVLAASCDDGRYFAGFHASISLKRIDSNPLLTGPNRAFLFCPIRDNVQCLPWFLDYYRNLGIERFFFIDNNSQDGTTEHLLQQPDVHLFWTEDSFKKAHAGMRWINELIGEYGEGNWCLFVDSDEALVFPGMEKKGLRHLLNYMDNHGHEAMFCFMLDMHPSSLAENFIFESGDNPLTHSPYFCNEYREFSDFRAPYRCVKGGIREKLFQTHEMLEKVPLTKGGKGVRYLGNHNITPAQMSDVTGILLHFNFTFKPQLLNDAWQLQADAGIDDRHGFCKARYSRYQEVFSQMESDFSFMSDTTEKYRDSEQLMQLGLMQKPDDY